MSMKINIDDITIKIKIIDEVALKAIVSLNFGDFVVKGFRVQKSKFDDEKGAPKPWITPPVYRAGNGTYHPIFYIPDKDLWSQLQSKIEHEYRIQTDEHYRKMYGLPKKEEEEGQINVDEINF
jgi:DNA-binding cell septation regulator SpoVG